MRRLEESAANNSNSFFFAEKTMIEENGKMTTMKSAQ